MSIPYKKRLGRTQQILRPSIYIVFFDENENIDSNLATPDISFEIHLSKDFNNDYYNYVLEPMMYRIPLPPHSGDGRGGALCIDSTPNEFGDGIDYFYGDGTGNGEGEPQIW
jgi:hypothetical protein